MFFGTPAWAVPSLEALLGSEIEVVAVVTNPDRASGRGLRERPSPVKVQAASSGLEVLQPQRAKDPAFHQRIVELAPDIACVVAYGKLLPPPLLDVPPLGFINAHFSLLPSYRGAAPVQWTLIHGDPATGISIMVLTEGMDEGPILASQRVTVHPSDTAATLGWRLAQRAAPFLVETLTAYGKGLLRPVPQPKTGVSYAPKLTSQDVRINWSRDARAIDNLIRGADPDPGAWTTFRGKRIKLLRAASRAVDLGGVPGSVELVPDGLVVACGRGSLLVIDAQSESKRPMPAADLGRGLHLGEDERFE